MLLPTLQEQDLLVDTLEDDVNLRAEVETSARPRLKVRVLALLFFAAIVGFTFAVFGGSFSRRQETTAAAGAGVDQAGMTLPQRGHTVQAGRDSTEFLDGIEELASATSRRRKRIRRRGGGGKRRGGRAQAATGVGERRSPLQQCRSIG